jgi:ABC-2 type transport system permease protein
MAGGAPLLERRALMAPVLLVARRDFLAYVGAWGFWISLVTAPLLIALLMFGPVLLARAEPPRALVILAERSGDAEDVSAAFATEARRAARAEIGAYLAAAAPAISSAALQAFDAEPERGRAIAAAQSVVRERAPRALSAFPQPSPRYVVVAAPAGDIDALRPYLEGTRTLADGRPLFGALNLRREAGAPVVEYWSVNLSHEEPTSIARRVLRLTMQREALAAQGLAPSEADRLNAFDPRVEQFDPRAAAEEARVTLRERAPAFAALALAFVLWTVVFSVANMLLSGVIEEKSNRILDTLLTSVTPAELLVGKLLGVAAVSATLFLFWGVLGGTLLGMAATQLADSMFGQVAAAFLEPRLIAAFGVGFIAGYLMYGAIFLALGSLCDSIQEAQTLLGPVAFVLAMPMVLVLPALDNPNAPIIEAASWVPLFTPFLLLMRAPGGLEWSEIAGMGALMLACVTGVLLLAAQVFRAGVANQLSFAGLMRRKAQG